MGQHMLQKKKYNIGYDICDGICCNMGREIKQQKIISICYNKLLRHMLQRMLSTSNGNISSMWYIEERVYFQHMLQKLFCNLSI